MVILQAWDWNNESTPLVNIGEGQPKFLSPVDKHSTNEGIDAKIVQDLQMD